MKARVILCLLIVAGLVFLIAKSDFVPMRQRIYHTGLPDNITDRMKVSLLARDAPNAKRDLMVVKSFWQKNWFGEATHTFYVWNMSRRYEYVTARLTFTYFDASGAKVKQYDRRIGRTFPAGVFAGIDKFTTGPVGWQADSASIVISE